MSKKIVILGGTFNPPHIAHVEIIEYIHQQLNTQLVYVIPAIAWQKKHIIAPYHRLAMTQLTYAHLNYVDVNSMEIDAQTPSYTIETLKNIKALHPETQLYFIIGYDQLLNLNTWYEWQNLHDYAHIYIVKRKNTENNIQILSQDIHLHIVSNAQCFTLSKWQPTCISSTYIRSLLQQKQWNKVAPYLHKNVIDYIRYHKLYSQL